MNRAACPQFEGIIPTTTIRTTKTTVQEIPVDGTTTCHYAVECLRPIRLFSSLLSDSTRPTTVAVVLLLAPHPSILHVLINYHYLTRRAPLYFIAHLLIIYALSFLSFSSLIACVARDPGPVPDAKSEDISGGSGGGAGGDEISIEDALLNTAPSDDYTQPGRWCRICWRPKPERAHHCSQCGRCVLKMGACPLAVSVDTVTHTLSFTVARNIACRSPLSLDGRKMHRASFLPITVPN